MSDDWFLASVLRFFIALGFLWLAGCLVALIVPFRRAHSPQTGHGAPPRLRVGHGARKRGRDAQQSKRVHDATDRKQETTRRLLTVEERICRCDVCGGPFVLRYKRDEHRGNSDTPIISVWVRCGRPDCHHKQPVLVPISARRIRTKEWLGSATATPNKPTLREILMSASAKKD